jgi:class 3 adenylate cyclase
MPIYMDRHDTVESSRQVIAAAHERDLAMQDKYGVRFITYWVDEDRSKVFCLVEAPNKDALQKVHEEAHGNTANEIIEVDPAMVEAFLGRVMGLPIMSAGGRAQLDPALRTIMFTDLQDSTGMTARLGDAKALDLLHTHNSLTRKALREYTGREVKHLGDGIMASFASIDQALECAMAIQRAFAAYNVQNSDAPLHLRIGLSVGEPVEDDNDFFGRTVQLASRVCTHAKPDQILATEDVIAQSAGKTSLFLSRSPIRPKGFDQEIQVYEVLWSEG